MDVISSLGFVALMSLFAVVAGIFEDLESDAASTSNPNSQVQLAPQIGNLHKYFNRAVSGEPLLAGTMATIAGVIAYTLIQVNQPIPVVLIVSSLAAAIIQVVLSITSYMGRIASQALYNQPLFMDVLYKHVPISAAHTFISLFSIVTLSYIPVYFLLPPVQLALPIATFLMGITLGSVGSAVGDIYYGAEKLYQHYEFGAGIPVSTNGHITTKSPLGSENSIDVVDFCSKFGGPLSGLCFGIIIFLNYWLTIVFGIYYGLIVGFALVVLLVAANYLLERNARQKYGKYEE